jgi:hypothetical protein
MPPKIPSPFIGARIWSGDGDLTPGNNGLVGAAGGRLTNLLKYTWIFNISKILFLVRTYKD